MAKRKKRRNLGPRRKRMKRAARLQSAAGKWTYRGKGLVRGYARWFAVDPICAVVELRLLGIEISAEREQQVRQAVASRATARAKQHAARLAAEATLLEPDPWLNEWLPFDVDPDVDVDVDIDIDIDDIPF